MALASTVESSLLDHSMAFISEVTEMGVSLGFSFNFWGHFWTMCPIVPIAPQPALQLGLVLRYILFLQLAVMTLLVLILRQRL